MENKQKTNTLTSYEFVIWNASEHKELEPPKQKEYEIWVGHHHLGQGYTASDKAQLLGRVKATSFKIACYLYVLDNQAKHIREEMIKPNAYVEDTHFGKLYYNPETNSNSWLGKYYETKEEAMKTFQ